MKKVWFQSVNKNNIDAHKNNSLKWLIMSALYREQSIKEANKKMSDEFIEEAIKKSPILLL